MNNIYKTFQDVQELMKQIKIEKEELEEKEKDIEFRKDIQQFLADIIVGKDKHGFPFRLASRYKKLGIATKQRHKDYSFISVSMFGEYNDYFIINKTNISKIEKYLEGDDDLSIKQY